jgi:hypothetical protein
MSLGLCGFCACGRLGNADSAVSQARVYAPAGRTIDWNATSTRRFGFDRPAPSAHGADKGTALPPSAEAAAQTPEPGSGYHWSPPQGWRRGPDKAMREVTFLAGEHGEVECYVTRLAGEGGGIASNLDRWRGQLGQPPLTAEELAALPRFPMLGSEAVSIEITRAAGQVDGPQMLLGAVCMLPGQSLFVKLLGPRAAVEAQREPFLQFCRSIEAVK